MKNIIQRIGKIPFFLSVLFIILLLLPTSLSAMGSEEVSREYDTNLQNLFEELIVKVEADDITGTEAKERLSALRSRYKVEYNDFAGKVDAIIDEVEEKKKGYITAIEDFITFREDFYRVQNRNFEKDSRISDESNKDLPQTEGNSAERSNDPPRKKN